MGALYLKLQLEVLPFTPCLIFSGLSVLLCLENVILVNLSVLLTFNRGAEGKCSCQLQKSFLKNIEVINIIVLYHLQIDSGKPGILFSPFPSCPGSDVGPADRFK